MRCASWCARLGSVERSKGGVSLLEVMVASALALLLLTLLLSTLIPLTRESLRGYGRMAQTQSAILASNRIRGDVQSSTLAGILLPNGTDQTQYMSAQPIDWVTDQGVRVWGDTFAIYCWDRTAQTLIRRQVKPDASILTLSPDAAFPITSAQAVQVFQQPAGSSVVLATGLVEFTLAQQPDGSQPFSLHMTFSQAVQGRTTPEQFVLDRKFYLRNNT